MDQIPYFLKQDVQVDPSGTVNLFNYDNLEAAAAQSTVEQSTSIWSELSGDFSKTTGYVFDSVKGVWTSVKDEVVGDLNSVYSGVKWEIIFWVAAGVLVIWIIAKSGILTQAAALKPI